MLTSSFDSVVQAESVKALPSNLLLKIGKLITNVTNALTVAL